MKNLTVLGRILLILILPPLCSIGVAHASQNAVPWVWIGRSAPGITPHVKRNGNVTVQLAYGQLLRQFSIPVTENQTDAEVAANVQDYLNKNATDFSWTIDTETKKDDLGVKWTWQVIKGARTNNDLPPVSGQFFPADANTKQAVGGVQGSGAYDPSLGTVFFEISGGPGTSLDELSVDLSQPNSSNFDTFSLSSYSGLSASQVMSSLIQDINNSGKYTAQMGVDDSGNPAVVVSGADVEFGASLYIDTTDGSVPDFSGGSGVLIPNTSSPTIPQWAAVIMACALIIMSILKIRTRVTQTV